MSAVDEAVVVGELDERTRPALLDGVDLGQHLVHWLDLIARRQTDRRGAELAAPWAAPLSLDGDPVVALDVEEVEPGHRGVREVELAALRCVDPAKAARREVVEQV